jgi:hypothetical protein
MMLLRAFLGVTAWVSTAPPSTTLLGWLFVKPVSVSLVDRGDESHQRRT